MRTLLVLARISNLPTVWSNCLAAWLLCGDGSWGRFSLLCLGATLLYTGGMFLNDAVDEGFDRRYRPERPIPSGRIGSRTVWILSCLLLITGWGTFALLGGAPAILSAILLITIACYDVVHKRTALAPLLMAACRFLVYVLAASVLNREGSRPVLWWGGALAAYIVGLSYLARGESTGSPATRWPTVLLFAPALVALIQPSVQPWNRWLALLAQISWTFWCLAGRKPRALAPVPQGVAGLLAGIALVDLTAASCCGMPIAFLALFFLAILLQRIAPAT
jgi:hypothetical protein